MADDERQWLLKERQGKGDKPVADEELQGKGDKPVANASGTKDSPPSYRSFVNLALETEDQAASAGDIVHRHTASQDLQAVSVAIIGSEQEDAILGGEEILFRLRMAHIYGHLEWAKHLRQLKEECREDVHTQILDTLREQPIDIGQKKNLSRYLRNRLDSVSVTSVTMDARKKQNHSRSGFNLKTEIWNSNIGKISAYFGSHIASYFVFLRFLVILDIFLAVLLFGLVTLPQILSNEQPADGLSGDFGYVSKSVMLFGAYDNTTWDGYDRPLAYFLTWAGVNVLSFLIIVASMYINYSTSKRSESSEDEFPFSARVFSSWDHTVHKSEGAALRKTAIVMHTKEMIREERSPHSTFKNTLAVVTVRLLINLGVVGLLGGSGYLIFLVAVSSSTSLGLPDALESLFATYKLPLMVVALKVCVPPLFEQMIQFEKWAPRTELKLTITRTALFYLASLVVLLLSMYDVSTECIGNDNSTANSSVCCWENEVGEMLLKVVLIDLGQIVLTTILLDHCRAALVKSGRCSALGFREFSLASEVLDVIYGQSLIWLGLYFSPLLAIVGFLKVIIVFYLRYVTARLCCVPPRKVFRASRSGSFFMFILLLHFFVCLFTMTYAIIEIEPSTDCGPFREEKHVYEILTSRVGDLPRWLRDVIVYVSTPAVIVPFILFLLLSVLFFKAKSSSYAKVIKKLRDQLKFERRVEKREVFARAQFVQGQQICRTPSVARYKSSSRMSLSDEATVATSTT